MRLRCACRQYVCRHLAIDVAARAVTQAFLKAEGSPKVGITGFCMGGALTLGGLAESPEISCGAPFYGVNFGLFNAEQLASKPVQGHFGAEVRPGRRVGMGRRCWCSVG